MDALTVRRAPLHTVAVAHPLRGGPHHLPAGSDRPGVTILMSGVGVA